MHGCMGFQQQHNKTYLDSVIAIITNNIIRNKKENTTATYTHTLIVTGIDSCMYNNHHNNYNAIKNVVWYISISFMMS